MSFVYSYLYLLRILIIISEKPQTDVAYKLKLPPTMKIHPVINICKLAAFTDNNIEGCKQKHPGPVVIEPEGDRYEIVCIVNSQYRN
jgi:hypothetical protein